MDQHDPLEQFRAILERDLEGCEVCLSDEPPSGEAAIHRALLGGRHLIITLGESADTPEDVEARLDALLKAFSQTLATEEPQEPRLRPAQSLQRELEALSSRAGALDALVIDSDSPIVWASGTAGGPLRPDGQLIALTPELRQAMSTLNVSRRELIRLLTTELEGERYPAAYLPEEPAGPDPERGERALGPLPASSRRAIRSLRRLPDLGGHRRGGHARLVTHDDDGSALAHGFADIYWLVLVFPGPFDELRAERELLPALPTIERLVIALPPLDPEPVQPGKVIALRRR